MTDPTPMYWFDIWAHSFGDIYVRLGNKMRERDREETSEEGEKCRHIQMHWHMQIIELGIADMLTIVSEPSDFLYPFEYVCVCVCVCLLSLLVGASI